MARPAIVENRHIKGPWVQTRTRKSTGVTTTTKGVSDYRHYLITKPASKPTPRGDPRAMTEFNSFRRVQDVRPSAHVTMEDTSYVTTVTGTSGSVFMDTVNIPTVPAWMHDESLQRALLKLRDQKVNLGLALTESKRTAGLIDVTVSKINRQIRNFRRRNPKKVWRNIVDAENVPNSWLELQYGWTPLLSDIVGSMAAVEAAEETSLPGHFKVVGRVRDVTPVLVPPRTSGSNFMPGWVGSNALQATTVLHYAADDPLLITMNQMGILTPEEILWEMTRASFIVDWFLPVGDWLAARTADYGWRFIRGCTSDYVVTSAGNAEQSRSWVNGSTRLSARLLSRADMQGYRFYRTVYNRSPSTRILLKNPISTAGSVQRALSASAILQRNFRY